MQTAVRATLIVVATAMMSACGSGGPSKTPGDYLPGDFGGGGDAANAACGNGRIEGAEVCDGANLDNQTCATRGFAAGILRCTSDCTDFNVSGCTTCGNDNKDAGEACDGTDLGGATCEGLGFEGGTLGCNRSCDAYDTDECRTTSSCGDNVATDPEICDGSDLRGKSCRTLGFESGTLGCSASCNAFDTSDCVSNAECGNDTIEVPEVCDGTDLDGEDCVSKGYASGTLACNATCSAFVFTGCQAAACGNGVQEPGEACDGSDLGDETCQSRGFISGTLSCNANCQSFNTSSCVGTPECGNGTIEGAELCDSSALGGQSCQSLGFRDGTLSCNTECAFDTTNCSGEQQGMCGNGVINGVEFCDGDAWVYGADCATYNMGAGMVDCTPECQPDFSACAEPDLCAANGWYGDGYCDACDLLGGNDDPDCASLCPQADGDCVSYFDTLTGVFTCRHAGYTDPDCGTCGDDVAEEPEWCDGADLAGLTCADFGFIGGVIACADDCTADLAGCINPVCGNDLVEGQEVCDGTDLDDLGCTDLGFAGGILGCQTNCQGFDTGRCEASTCDGAAVEVGEVCDGTHLGGVTCATLGLSGAGIACANDCLSFDATGCGPRPTAFTCGDEDPNGLEVCEGSEWSFGTGACMDVGLTDGDLGCTASCMTNFGACSPGDLCAAQGWYGDGYCDACELLGGSIDADCDTYCSAADDFCADYFDVLSGTWTCRSKGLIDPDCGACGNGVTEGSEYCDGGDLGQLNCTDFGFLSGDIACAADCTPDFLDCQGPICGDGIISEGEACDKGGLGGSENLDGLTCAMLGFPNPPDALHCAADCRTYDISGCTDVAACGNSALDPGETCDGDLLGGETCESLGLGLGTLACDADSACMAYDTSSCIGGVATCGDDVVNGAEWCDGNDWTIGPACSEFAMGAGDATCTSICTVDFSSCEGSQDLCEAQNWYNDGYCDACDRLGGVVDPDCGVECADNGYCADYYDSIAGVWTCRHLGLIDPDCGTCGDGIIEGNEYCDGVELGGYSCIDYGFGDGTLACSPRCIPDFSGCGAAACGNNIIEGGEFCDGTDVLGFTCEDLGFTGGTLSCNGTCDDFLTTGCTNPASTLCGDGEANGIEWCDTDAWVTGPACADFDMGTGNATCTDACTIDFGGCSEDDYCAAQSPSWYDDGVCDPCELMGGHLDNDCTTLCVSADGYCEDFFDAYTQVWTCTHLGLADPDCGTCGDGLVEGNEWCDGTALDGRACDDYGYAGGTLACTGRCVPDFVDCTEAACPNGVIDGNEVCDGLQLGGETCQGLGYLGGTLACAADCSDFVTTGCTEPSEWTCNPMYYDGDDGCDCGCGLFDPDCPDALVGSCDYCDNFGSCDDTDTCDNIAPTDNAVCESATWTCNPAFLGDGDCDCGCGIVDTDCADATLASCDFCGLSGSCSDQACANNTQINPDDNAVCL